MAHAIFPPEIWVRIFEYDRTPLLSWVNTWLHRLLRDRPVTQSKMALLDPKFPETAVALQSAPDSVGHLKITARGQSIPKETQAAVIATLGRLRALRTLEIAVYELPESGHGAAGFFRAISFLPNLETLRLEVLSSVILPIVNSTPMEIQEMPCLRTLHWIMDDDKLHDDNVAATVRLLQGFCGIRPDDDDPDSPAGAQLRSLRLSLMGNHITAVGAAHFAALRRMAGLTNLSLDLNGNRIGDAGAQALSTLRALPAVTRLSLCLSSNGIGDLGAAALADFVRCPTLTDFFLYLWGNDIGLPGATALARLLVGGSNLLRLTLNVEENPLGAAGEAVLLHAPVPDGLTYELDL